MKRRQLTLDMGYRPDEFAQTLQGGFCSAEPRLQCHGSLPEWTLEDAKGLKTRLHIAPLPERRIGMLRLPRLQVELEMTADAESSIDDFLQRFHRHFHKGGG